VADSQGDDSGFRITKRKENAMYVRTMDGLGPEQQSWSAPQALDRVTIRPVHTGYLGRLSEQMGNDEESCDARYNVEYFPPGSDKLTAVIRKDLQDIWKNMYALLQRKLAKIKGRKVDIKKDVKLHIYVKGYVDVHKGSDPQDHEYLDTRRAFAVLEPLHLQAFQKVIPRQSIEYDYSGAGQFLPRNAKSGKNRRAEVCIRWEIN
jgi:hypothetical protein